jgi:VanZ family protein
MFKFSMVLKGAFWVCFVVTSALALMPGSYLPPVFNWWDKAQHAMAFGTLTLLAALAYPAVSKFRIGFLLLALGVLIEVLQYFSGYRYGDWQDAVADGVGVLVGLGSAMLLMRFDGFVQLMGLKPPKETDEH